MSVNTNILFIEDSDLDYELMLRALKQAEFSFTPFRATTISEFQQLINEVKPDIVISDYNLVGFTGFQVIEKFIEVKKDIPLIVVSSNIGEEKAVEALRMGATDYMLKSHIKKLPHVINRALDQWRVKIQRKRTLAALRRREHMYGQLLNAMQDGLLQLNPALEITFANPAFVGMIGYNNIDELIGKNLSAFLKNKNQDVNHDSVIELYHVNGSTVFCEVSVSDIIENTNSLALVLKDITAEIEQKKITQELNKELDMLIYRIAHDLRGPLCSLEGLINLSKEDITEDWNKLATNQINNSYTILDKLTSLVQIRKHQILASKITLFDVFESLSYENQHINFEYNKSNFNINTDKELLKQALEPIIDNAAKYKKAGEQATLKIEVSNKQDELTVILTDQGIGIEQNKLTDVLQMFYKGNNNAGLGLGLYISKIIIEKLGGSITLKSNIDEFTSVEISLPK